MKYCPACHKTYPGEYTVCPADQTGLQSAHELQPGMVIRNKYEILERIGIGGMGFVYRGRHITFNELCAIKIVNDVIAGDKNFLQRFQTEAIVTRKLRHPNAVRVDDFDYTEDGRPFIVMELVEGKNVGETLQQEGPLRVPRAVRIAAQVAGALGTAHKLGVIHRDIKPGNIILTKDEQENENAKVLDFGIAKLREAAGGAQTGMTMTGMVVGTPLYMSPEQFLGKKAGGEIDGRTDIYSLGVVLYQMVTAQLPFEGDTLYSIMMQHMEGIVRPPHKLKPELEIPESLSRVILKAIDKSRDNRFQTAEDFVAALNQVAQNPDAESPAGIGRIRGMVAPASIQSTPASPSGSTPAPSVPANIAAPRSSSSVPIQPPVVAETTPAKSAVVASPADPLLVKSAERHLFLQPRKFRLKHLLILVALVLVAVLVAGVGYLKYQEIWRSRIESEITQKLNTAPSLTLRQSVIRVFVSDTREVTLVGNVPSADDFTAAGALAGSVPGVTGVNNRIQVFPSVQKGAQTGVQSESSESLIDQGIAFMDAGDYPSAINCFTKASADPNNNKRAQELLDRARRAQKTEEELLRKRQ